MNDAINDKKENGEVNNLEAASSKILASNSVDYKLEENDRETWSGKFDFFLSALGYAVGLGAVWRFPYLCYKNGGGVFLIPYFVFLILVGIPLVFLELCVGQFTSSGPLTSWVMAPVFRGIGISMNTVNSYLCIYYNMIIAYSLYFLILSFNSVLPWEYCNPKWSSPNCVDNFDPSNFTFTKCDNINETLKCNNGRCYQYLSNISNITCNDTSLLKDIGWWHPVYPTQDYWGRLILQKTESINDTGIMIWQLVVSLLVGWLIVFAMVVKGIQVSGKIVYFTSLFPYVILLILGIRGWLLDGASDGIIYYVYPDFSRLKDITVWTDAANQIFFTLSVSYGGLVALSSYNSFNNNVMRDAIFVSLSNCLTSVFAGFVVFAYLGYIAKQTGQKIDDVIQAGQGLAFVVYPYAVTTIKGAPFWSIMFFFMMLILGLDTMMASVEIAITSILDLLPSLKKTRARRVTVISSICIIFFLMGLIFCTQSGTFWIEVVDNYSGGWAVLLIGALECISITWFYGYENFKLDISIMLGDKITNSKAFVIWRILWTVVSPLFIIVLVVLGIKDSKRLTTGSNLYPYWTEVLGNLMTISTLAGTVFYAIYMIIDALFINKRPLKTLITPNANWKPLKLEHQQLLKTKRDNLKYIKSGFNNESFDATEQRF